MGKLHSKGSAPYTSISIEQLKNFFGDIGASSLSEFWRGSGLVPDNEFNASVPFYPAAISLEDFYETTNETYVVTVDPGDINEGVSQTFNLTTTNIPNESPLRKVYYRIEGDVEEADFDSPVPDLEDGGYFEVNNNAATFDLNIKADLYSDLGLNPTTGVPTVRHENCIIKLYTDSSLDTALGNSVDGEANFLITDSSKTWYATVENPTASGTYPNQTYEVSASMTGDTFVGDTNADSWKVETGWTPFFRIKAINNEPTDWTVTTVLDTGYGYQGSNTAWRGRQVTITENLGEGVDDDDVLTYNNYNLYNGLSTNSEGTATYQKEYPNIRAKREITFADNLPIGTYTAKIQERGRFQLTETDGPGDPPRVLDTTNEGIHYCVFTTIVTFNVTEAVQ